MYKHKVVRPGGVDLEKIKKGEADALRRGYGDALPFGQIPNRQGYAPPVAVWDDAGGHSRLEQLMRSYAREHGGEWPYFVGSVKK